MYGTFFLGKNPNGKFFVTNNAESVAQQLADENGTELYEIVEGKKLSLKELLRLKKKENSMSASIKGGFWKISTLPWQWAGFRLPIL